MDPGGEDCQGESISNSISRRDHRLRLMWKMSCSRGDLGVHRQGHRLKDKIGDIRLRGGDVLLLDTSTDFVNEYKNNRNFALVSEVADSHQPRWGNLHKTCFLTHVLVGLIGRLLQC